MKKESETSLYSAHTSSFSNKDNFLWLLLSAIFIILIPITVSLSIKGKEIRRGVAQTIYPDGQGPEVCRLGGGVWTEFSDSCVDSCLRVTYPDTACLQVMTGGCDCGETFCWSGDKCVPDPTSFPTKFPTVFPTRYLSPTPLLTPIPTYQISPKVTFFHPSVTLTPIPRLVADANGDGLVNGFDYVVWFVNFGRFTAQKAVEGDFDGNGRVDGFDFVLWWQNFVE